MRIDTTTPKDNSTTIILIIILVAILIGLFAVLQNGAIGVNAESLCEFGRIPETHLCYLP